MATSAQLSRAQCDAWQSYVVAVRENAEKQARTGSQVRCVSTMRFSLSLRRKHHMATVVYATQ